MISDSGADVKDSQILAEAEKAKLEIDAIAGHAIEEMVNGLYEQSPPS